MARTIKTNTEKALKELPTSRRKRGRHFLVTEGDVLRHFAEMGIEVDSEILWGITTDELDELLFEDSFTTPNGHTVSVLDHDNTYNWGSVVTLQYHCLKDKTNCNSYVAVSYHIGGDVRGGYTTTVLYQCNEYEYLEYLSDMRISQTAVFKVKDKLVQLSQPITREDGILDIYIEQDDKVLLDEYETYVGIDWESYTNISKIKADFIRQLKQKQVSDKRNEEYTKILNVLGLKQRKEV